jgi:hypothetical protein
VCRKATPWLVCIQSLNPIPYSKAKEQRMRRWRKPEGRIARRLTQGTVFTGYCKVSRSDNTLVRRRGTQGRLSRSYLRLLRNPRGPLRGPPIWFTVGEPKGAPTGPTNLVATQPKGDFVALWFAFGEPKDKEVKVDQQNRVGVTLSLL